MSCNYPMLFTFDGERTVNGKPNWKYKGKWTDDVEFEYLRNPIAPSFMKKVPCGQCMACRLEKSRQWADRMILELGYHEESYFITLTYDSDHIPVSYPSDENGAALLENPVFTLVKKDFQDFMKRLRFYQGDNKSRFYGCGEYGLSTFRPHYHAIIFGLHLDDLQPFGKNELGQQYYLSEKLSQIWGKGFVSVGEVNWETCAYVARYVTKKLTGSLSGIYDFTGTEPEFSLMSRRPGIAWQYFDDHKDEIYKYNTINVQMEKSGRSIRSPRYYDKLFDLYSPDDFRDIKIQRQANVWHADRIRNSLSDLEFEERSVILDRSVNSRVNKLRRSLD